MTTIAIVNGKRTIVHSAKENAKEAISNFIGRLKSKETREREDLKPDYRGKKREDAED